MPSRSSEKTPEKPSTAFGTLSTIPLDAFAVRCKQHVYCDGGKLSNGFPDAAPCVRGSPTSPAVARSIIILPPMYLGDRCRAYLFR